MPEIKRCFWNPPQKSLPERKLFNMKIGILGLGKMGSRIAIKLHHEKHEVFVWNRTPKEILGVQSVKTIKELVSKLSKPRIFWIMLPSGEPTQTAIDELSKYLQKGDIVVDGGNANFKDTEARFRKFKKIGIEFLGIGVSGGIIAAKNGYPLMVGGSRKAYLKIKPILDSLSIPNGGHAYFGEGGAGHFVKMVHNAIEYGYMQSISEGFAVLEKSNYKFDLERIANLYRKNTLISGFMMDRAAEVLQKDPKLENLTGF